MSGKQSFVFDDHRSFVEFLKEKGELVTINRRVDSKHGAATVQMKVLNEMDKAVLFTNLDGKEQRMLGNIYTSRRMISYMFGVEPQRLVEKIMSFKTARRYPAKFMKKGACQEVV